MSAALGRPPQRPPLLVNPEFDLSAELAARHYQVSSVDRIRLMLSRYRQGRTPAIMENKLLAHQLLRSMGAPVAPILYGAFGSRALGAWPRYDRAGLVAALQRLRRKDFVLKSATDGMSHNLLLMSDARWRAEAWSPAKAAALVEQWILPQPDSHNQSGWYTRWGQRHEHRGVLLQAAAFDPQLLLCERYMAKKPEKASKRLLRRTQPYCTEPSHEWNTTAQSAFHAVSLSTNTWQTHSMCVVCAWRVRGVCVGVCEAWAWVWAWRVRGVCSQHVHLLGCVLHAPPGLYAMCMCTSRACTPPTCLWRSSCASTWRGARSRTPTAGRA